MTNAQHTWTIDGQMIISGNTAVAQYFYKGGNVEHSYFDNPSKETALANARLIATAPELLECLSDIVNHNGKNGGWDKAKAVIAKATGN